MDIFYQILAGNVDFIRHRDGIWSPGEVLSTKPVDASPLAVIGWAEDFRLYYLDANYIVQELCYSGGKFFTGEIGKMNAKATPGSGLAAIVWGPLQETQDAVTLPVHIRVYYQESGTNTLRELANDGSWYQGQLNVKNVLGGTGIAAVTYYFQRQSQIRVYYQSADLTLHEYGHNSSGWFEGEFSPGQATSETPIAAVVFGGVELQVYYRNLAGRVVFASNTGAWGKPVVIEPIGPGYKFAVIQMDNGKYLRLYYQLFDGALVEFFSNDGGKNWAIGDLKLQG